MQQSTQPPNHTQRPNPDWAAGSTPDNPDGASTQDLLSESEIRAWRDAGLSPDDANLLELALQWRSLGFNPSTAAEWLLVDDWDPEEALTWHLAGYTPRQGYFAATLTLFSQLLTPANEPPPSTAEEWATSTLTPETVCRSLAAAVATVEAAEELFLHGLEQPQIIHDLHIKGDALGADARALIIHPNALQRRAISQETTKQRTHPASPSSSTGERRR